MLITHDETSRLPEPLCKPDPRLWEYMVTQAGQRNIRFTQAVYIGDDPEKDGELVQGIPDVTFFLFDPDGMRGPIPNAFSSYDMLAVPPRVLS